MFNRKYKQPNFGAHDKPICPRPTCAMPMKETDKAYVCEKDLGGCGLEIERKEA